MTLTWKGVLVLALLAVALIGGSIFLLVSLLNARGAAHLAELNVAAAMDSSRVLLTDSITTLEGRRAAERLALQGEVEAKDAAIRERELQLGATARTLTRIRIQRDSLANLVLARRDSVTAAGDSVALYTADTLGVKATVEVQPAPDPNVRVRLSFSFEPVEVLQSFLKDEDGRVSLLAIADSLHSITVEDPPIFQPPERRGLFSWDLNVGPVIVTGVACGAAGLTAKLIGASWGEAGAVAGICAGTVVGLSLAF